MKGFIEMSKYAGMREDLVQAGGGNTAYKMAKGRMLVKASGVQLADVRETSGYAVVNPQMIVQAFADWKDLSSMTQEDAKQLLQEAFIEGGAPSIETFLHAMASGRYTLHTHPITVNVLTSRSDGMDTLKELFPDALIIPYATPGVRLASCFFQKYKENGRNTQIVFLQNHGLLVSAHTADEAVNITEKVARRIAAYLHMDLSAYFTVTELYRAIGSGMVWRVTDGNVWEAVKTLGKVWEFAFCPDCVVFLGKRMYDAGEKWNVEKYEQFCKKHGSPVLIAYRSELYIHADSVKKALEIQSVLSFAAQTAKINAKHSCNLLSLQEQDFLLGWEAETYRKKLT